MAKKSKYLITVTPAEIAAITSDAYAYEIYGKQAWTRAIELLIVNHHIVSLTALNGVLRSKYMRWAYDKMAVGFDAKIFTAYMSKNLTQTVILALEDR